MAERSPNNNYNKYECVEIHHLKKGILRLDFKRRSNNTLSIRLTLQTENEKKGLA